ncbi:MAG: hypothetical protein PQJ59_07735 [Spirochaetales bacterium]|nr:hypothetical protein [Spirochaetales bacterium]
MNENPLPLSRDRLDELANDHSLPFFLISEEGLKKSAEEINKLFSWVPGGFQNFFDVKALPNPYVLKILHKKGMGCKCFSLTELFLAESAGLWGADLHFTSQSASLADIKRARQMGAIITLDSFSHLYHLEQIGLPDLLSFSYNPSADESQNGLNRDKLEDAYRRAKQKGVSSFGLMIKVNGKNPGTEDYIRAVQEVLSTAADLNNELTINFDFVGFGCDGTGPGFDCHALSRAMKKLYTQFIVGNAMKPPRIYFESGPILSTPNSWLISDSLKQIEGGEISREDYLTRPGELLLQEDGSIIRIRRKERLEDYYSTLELDELDSI